MIRKECKECLSWDVPKNMCLRVPHGLTCVHGELPPGAWVKVPVGAAGAADNAIYKKIATNYDAKPTNPKDTIGIRKAPMSTVSAPVMAEIGVAMLEGAAKYGRHNYRVAGVRASVYYDATMRHLFSWWEGEDTDPDSGLSHVTKALASLAVLRDAMLNGKCEDDRPPRSAAFYPALNAKAAEILDKHVDKAPKHYTEADRSLARAGLADDTEAQTFGPHIDAPGVQVLGPPPLQFSQLDTGAKP